MGNYVAIGLKAKNSKAKSSVITVSTSAKIQAEEVSVNWERKNGTGKLTWTGDINENDIWNIGNTYFAEIHLTPAKGKMTKPRTGDDLGQVTVTIYSTPVTTITLDNQPLIHDP